MTITKILTFDTETTGVDVHSDRIVTAFLGLMDGTGHFQQQEHVLINPGIDIPEGATAVHSITTERAREHGRDPKGALHQVRWIIHLECVLGDTPLVVYNAPFDLTLLRAELERHGLPPLDMGAIVVIDPSVLDKELDTYRKGKRTLTAVAPVYGVPVEANAHDASADCLMAGRLALKMLARPKLASLSPSALHEAQVGWKSEQAASYEAYLHKTKPNEVVDRGWPIYEGVAA